MTTFTIEVRVTGLDLIAQMLTKLLGGGNPGYTFIPADPNPAPRPAPQEAQTVAQYNPQNPPPAVATLAAQPPLAPAQAQPQLPLQPAAPAARTIQDVKNAMAKLLSEKKMEPMAMVGILGKYGARRADDLKPEHIEVVLMELGA